jgi:hypothetical protein
MTEGESAHDQPSAKDIIESPKDFVPAPEDFVPAPELPSAFEEIKQQRAKVELNISKIVGYGALVIMVIQVGIADYVFIRYAQARNWGDVPTGAIQAWLAATVVQVIAVVLVIARSVFPADRRSE